MECITIALKSAVTDNSLPIVGAVKAVYTPTSLTVTPVRIGTTGAGVSITTDNGNFYSDAAGTVLIGKTATKTGIWSASLIYYKPDAVVAANWTIRNPQNITCFGTTDNSNWAPAFLFLTNGHLSIQADYLYYMTALTAISNIQIIGLTNTIITETMAAVDRIIYNTNASVPVFSGNGNIAFNSFFRTLKLTGLENNITLNLPPNPAKNIGYFEILDTTGTITLTFTGDGTVAFAGSVTRISIAKPFTSGFDNLLKSLSLVATWPGTEQIRLNGTRTSASDAAVAILISKLPGRFYINSVLQA